MSRLRVQIVLIFVTISVSTLYGSSTDFCGYSVQLLDADCSFPGAQASGLSAKGSVAGHFTCGLSGTQYGFVWQGKSATTFPIPNGFTDTSGFDANDLGDAAGRMSVVNPVSIMHPLLYSNGNSIDLPLLPGDTNGEALGIASDSTIVGYSYDPNSGPPKAVMWKDGKVMELLEPQPNSVVAEDINSQHQIVGWMGPPWAQIAFLWENGKVTNLGYLPESSSSAARGISSIGDAVGYGVVPLPGGVPGQTTSHACTFFDGAVTDLGVLPGHTRSDAQAVNINRLVVGNSSKSNGSQSKGFLWRYGTMIELTTLIPSDANVKIFYAFDINDAGQIAGVASDNLTAEGYAVLLTPIPPMPGDTNCDKIVDVDDLLVVINGWGTCKKFSPCPGDLTDNDEVDVDDLLLVINNWTI